MTHAPAERPVVAYPGAVHATAIVVGESGILIRGRSGSGKSTLALTLLQRTAADGLVGRLVGDDRVYLRAMHGRLVAEPHEQIAGRIELRGVGILQRPFAAKAAIRLVIDLVDVATDAELGPRLPSPEDASVLLAGVRLPCFKLRVGAGYCDMASRVLLMLSHVGEL